MPDTPDKTVQILENTGDKILYRPDMYRRIESLNDRSKHKAEKKNSAQKQYLPLDCKSLLKPIICN